MHATNADWSVELMGIRPSLPLAAGLLAVVAALSACGFAVWARVATRQASERRPDRHGRKRCRARNDLFDAQVVQWRDWRSIDDRTRKITSDFHTVDIAHAQHHIAVLRHHPAFHRLRPPHANSDAMVTFVFWD